MNNNRKYPPKVLSFILKKLTPFPGDESLVGDYEEYYLSILEHSGKLKAYFWYFIHIIKIIPSYLEQRIYWSFAMFKNYLKTVFRNFKRQKVYFFINVFGLTVGITCAVLILLWVQNELSYDRFFQKSGRIYRICSRGRIGDTEIKQTMTPAHLPATLKNDFPEVEQTVRLTPKFNINCQYEDKVFNEQNMVAADSAFFDVFSFAFIKGNAKTALKEPGTVVLTESTAKKYFGSDEPLNKIMIFDGNFKGRVTGVIENFPKNSHFHFDMILSLVSFNPDRNTDWWDNSYITYLALQKDYDSKLLTAKLPDFIIKYIFRGNQDWLNKGNTWEYFLQPLTEIHLKSNLEVEFEPNGNAVYVYIFSVVAVFVLMIACINFMNLTTARSANRAKEIGIRKVSGSKRIQLIRQFLFESVMLSFLASVFAIFFILIVLPVFNNFVGKSLELNLLKNPFTFSIFLALPLFVGFVSGIYPAFFLSSFKPSNVIKGKLREGIKSSRLRNALIVFQFSVSIILIIGMFVIGKQLDFLNNTDLGFNKESVVIIKNVDSIKNQKEAFKEELKKYSGISSVSGSYSFPGKHFINQGFLPEDKESILLNITFCEPAFKETFQLEMTEGRFFSREQQTGSAEILINETAVKHLGWDEPVGKTFTHSGFNLTFRVIGVVKDFFYKSLHQSVEPMALLNLNLNLGWRENYISVRINSGSITETLNYISKTWDSFTEGKPFEYSFLDEEYNNLYRNEQQTENIFMIFSSLAIFIALIGLYGLISFTTGQRKKEIGIRKVLGSSVCGIIKNIIKNFVVLIILANVIAWPAAYYIMNKWLDNFAYKANLDLWVFLSAGLLVLLIAVITIISQSLKAAASNPVDSLRYE